MKPVHFASVALTAGIALSCAVLQAYADGEKVQFPQDYAGGVHYATINHGTIREELFTSQAAIDALKSGQPMPSGTVITVEDYRTNALCCYVVMEKRTGEWEFQWFNPNKTVKVGENLDLCRSCHTSQASQDFVFTAHRVKDAH